MIELDDIQAAAELLKSAIVRTPLIYAPTLSKMMGLRVYLKLENLQNTGSFKLRGATYKIQRSLPEIAPRGVVAASAGNHAQGVALSARLAGLRSLIVMPEWASISKQEATRDYGGEVVLFGQSMNESIDKALELAEEGRTFIHPYDDYEIIVGQGTIGLEILHALPDPDFIFVPIGGGGLISGIATAVKALRPQTRIVGVQASACPSALHAIRAGHVVKVEASRSIADGITVKQIGNIPFEIVRSKVDEITLVEEGQIAAAVLMLLERKKILAEGAGAAPLAALFTTSSSIPKGSKVVLVISGGNMDSPLLDRVIRQGLFRNGRIMRFSIALEDAPGSLAKLLAIVAGLQANVMNIHHDRIGRDLSIHASRVELELETRGTDHIAAISQCLESAGYKIE